MLEDEVEVIVPYNLYTNIVVYCKNYTEELLAPTSAIVLTKFYTTFYDLLLLIINIA